MVLVVALTMSMAMILVVVVGDVGSSTNDDGSAGGGSVNSDGCDGSDRWCVAFHICFRLLNFCH